MNANRCEHGREQGMLVLTIAVLVSENVSSGMRLESTYAEREAYVSNLRSDVVVERADLVDGRLLVLGEFESLLAQFGRGLNAVPLQRCVPVTEFFPALERSQLN